MKSRWKMVPAALLATGCLLPLSAAAQSAGVTLYGAVDNAVERADNGSSHVVRMSSGLNAISRFGLMGSEDLGGGMKARFRIESALNADDGSTNAKFFNRFSHVGLEGAAGAIDLGRMYSPTFNVGVAADPFVRNRTSLIQTLFLAQSSATANAVIPGFLDNSVKYTTPLWNGLWADAMYTFGESTNTSGNGTAVSVQYLKGPLYLGYGYQALRSGSSTAVVANPLNTETHVLGARYTLGSLTLYGHVNRNLAAGAPNSTNSAVAVRWEAGGPHTLIAQAAHRSVATADANATGVLLGYNYALSKRSAVYARYGKVRNDGLSNVSLNGNTLTARGADPSTASIGISHLF